MGEIVEWDGPRTEDDIRTVARVVYGPWFQVERDRSPIGAWEHIVAMFGRRYTFLEWCREQVQVQNHDAVTIYGSRLIVVELPPDDLIQARGPATKLAEAILADLAPRTPHDRGSER